MKGMEISMFNDGYEIYRRENIPQLKRKLSLDLNGGRTTKKVRGNNVNFNALLTSPDLHMLKLASPELDELVLQQGGCLMPTPSGGFVFPSQNGAIKVSTPSTDSTHSLDSEEFVKGFKDTLDQMHQNDSVIVSSNQLSGQLQYTQLESIAHHVPVTSSSDDMFLPTHIKEELQTVPSVCISPPISPIDMQDQERIKLERKRLRNRIAASKCRRRKLEKISKLESKVGVLKDDNTDLMTVVNRLRDQVCQLKQEVIEHVNSGCQISFVN